MRKFIKKLLKIILYIFIALCSILLLAEISLRYILPSDTVKAKTLAYLSRTTGADIKTGKIAASFFGITLEDVVVNVEEQRLFDCKTLQVSLSPFKLLLGQLFINKIIIQDPSVKIIRDLNGKFNFDPLLTAAEEQEEAKKSGEARVPFDIRIKHFAINNSQVSYSDLKENMKANLQNLNFDLHRFSFFNHFDYTLSFDPYFEQNNIIFDGANFSLNGETNLNELNLQGAVAGIKSFLFKYKETVLQAKMNVNNFENPSGHISAELKNLSNNTLSAFTETVPFNIPLIKADLTFDYFTEAAKANIKSLAVKTTGAELNLEANVDLNKSTVSDGKLKFVGILDYLREISPLIEEFKPAGQINADFNFAWPLVLGGNLILKDIGLFTDKAGTLEDFNTTVNVKSIEEVTIDTFSGKLNNNPFTMKASYLKKKDFADVFLDFKADKLYVFNTSKPKEVTPAAEQAQKTETKPTATEEKTEKAAEAIFPPINVDAKVDIKKLDVPFIKGNNLLFTAKAKNITTQMNKTHGTFDLKVQNGQIKDIYTISNANTITKVMFMSLGIVSKVINTLNVLDLLSGMGKMLTGSNEEAEELPVHQEINGKMDFDSFNTKIDFNEGLATMKRCSFVSSLFSFRVNGNINFDNRKIKLNVESAPGKHTENGIMPLNIDIKGTIEDPKGSLSVISSVSELVTNTITNNPVSNMLKSTWGALFRTESEEEATPAPEGNEASKTVNLQDPAQNTI